MVRPIIPIPEKKSLINIDDPYTLKDLGKLELIEYNNPRFKNYRQFITKIRGAPVFWNVEKKDPNWREQLIPQAKMDEIREKRLI